MKQLDRSTVLRSVTLVLGAISLAGASIMVLRSLPDLVRYLKIRRM